MAQLASTLFRLPAARGRLAFWRGVLLTCLAVPFLPAPFSSHAFVTGRGATAIVLAVPPLAATPARMPLGLVTTVLVLGVCMRASFLALSLRRLCVLRCTSTPIEVERDLASRVRAVAPSAEIRTHPRVHQPVTFGVGRPLILVPRRLLDMPVEVQRGAVLHEAFHIARHDWLSLLAEQMVVTLFWFHPAMWWAVDRIQLAREQRVDDLVVEMIGSRQAYVRSLLWFDHTLSEALLAASLLGRRHLLQRIRALSPARPASVVRSAVMALILVATTVAATVGATSLVPLRIQNQAETIYEAGKGVTLPVVVREVRPQYTQAALNARIEGRVLLECVVMTDGKPARIVVAKSLDADFGLDAAAVQALNEWRFKPGTKDGRPVAVRVHIELTFTLK